MKTYKIYYYTHEIVFEADAVHFTDGKMFFYKGETFIASIPDTCPYTIIGIKPNDNEK